MPRGNLQITAIFGRLARSINTTRFFSVANVLSKEAIHHGKKEMLGAELVTLARLEIAGGDLPNGL